MKIVCGSCGAKYSIADEKVQGKVFKIRCKKCSNVIVVKGDSQHEEPQSQQAQADSGMAGAYGGTSAAAEWYVVVDGEQVGPISPEEIEAYYASGQIHDQSFAWRDGLGDWVALAELDEFAHLAQLNGHNADATSLMESPFAAEQPADADTGYDDDATSLMPASEFRAQFAEKDAEAAAAAGGDAGVGAQADYSSADSYAAGDSAAGYDTSGSYDSGASYDTSGSYDSGAGYDTSGSYDSGASYDTSGSYDSGAGYDAGGYDAAGYDSGGSYDDGGYDAYGDDDASNQGMFSSFDSGADGADSGYDSFDGFGDNAQDSQSGAASANEMIGQRNENSVLFSLSSLDQVSAVSNSADAPAGSADGAGAGEGAVTEGSGLIDIQALASAHKAMKGSGQADGPANIPGAGESFGAGTMSMPALMPMGSHKSNKPLIIGLVVLGVLLLAGFGGVIYVLTTKDDPKPVVQEVVQQPAAAPAAQNAAAADPAAANDEAQAAAAAAKAVDDEKAADPDEDEKALAQAAAEDEDKEEEKTEKAKSDNKSKSSASRKSAPSKKVASKSSSSRPAKSTSKSKSKSDGDIFDLLDRKEGSKGSKSSASGGSAAPAKSVPKKLSRSMVQKTIAKYRSRVHNCYTGSNRNKMSGTVFVNYSIQPSGRVKSATVSTAKFKGTDVGKCVEGVVRSMKFPETQSSLTVNYPFKLK